MDSPLLRCVSAPVEVTSLLPPKRRLVFTIAAHVAADAHERWEQREQQQQAEAETRRVMFLVDDVFGVTAVSAIQACGDATETTSGNERVELRATTALCPAAAAFVTEAQLQLVHSEPVLDGAAAEDGTLALLIACQRSKRYVFVLQPRSPVSAAAPSAKAAAYSFLAMEVPDELAGRWIGISRCALAITVFGARDADPFTFRTDAATTGQKAKAKAADKGGSASRRTTAAGQKSVVFAAVLRTRRTTVSAPASACVVVLADGHVQLRGLRARASGEDGRGWQWRVLLELQLPSWSVTRQGTAGAIFAAVNADESALFVVSSDASRCYFVPLAAALADLDSDAAAMSASVAVAVRLPRGIAIESVAWPSGSIGCLISARFIGCGGGFAPSGAVAATAAASSAVPAGVAGRSELVPPQQLVVFPWGAVHDARVIAPHMPHLQLAAAETHEGPVTWGKSMHRVAPLVHCHATLLAGLRRHETFFAVTADSAAAAAAEEKAAAKKGSDYAPPACMCARVLAPLTVFVGGGGGGYGCGREVLCFAAPNGRSLTLAATVDTRATDRTRCVVEVAALTRRVICRWAASHASHPSAASCLAGLRRLLALHALWFHMEDATREAALDEHVLAAEHHPPESAAVDGSSEGLLRGRPREEDGLFGPLDQLVPNSALTFPSSSSFSSSANGLAYFTEALATAVDAAFGEVLAAAEEEEDEGELAVGTRSGSSSSGRAAALVLLELALAYQRRFARPAEGAAWRRTQATATAPQPLARSSARRAAAAHHKTLFLRPVRWLLENGALDVAARIAAALGNEDVFLCDEVYPSVAHVPPLRRLLQSRISPATAALLADVDALAALAARDGAAVNAQRDLAHLELRFAEVERALRDGGSGSVPDKSDGATHAAILAQMQRMSVDDVARLAFLRQLQAHQYPQQVCRVAVGDQRGAEPQPLEGDEIGAPRAASAAGAALHVFSVFSSKAVPHALLADAEQRTKEVAEQLAELNTHVAPLSAEQQAMLLATHAALPGPLIEPPKVTATTSSAAGPSQDAVGEDGGLQPTAQPQQQQQPRPAGGGAAAVQATVATTDEQPFNRIPRAATMRATM